jgi:sRNA-binding regulator protein Hfq
MDGTDFEERVKTWSLCCHCQAEPVNHMIFKHAVRQSSPRPISNYYSSHDA